MEGAFNGMGSSRDLAYYKPMRFIVSQDFSRAQVVTGNRGEPLKKVVNHI